MLGHKKLLEDLLNEARSWHIHSVIFVQSSDFNLSTKDQVRSLGLDEFKPIFFTVDGLPYSEHSTSVNESNLRGATINLRVEDRIEQIVLVQEDCIYPEHSWGKDIKDDWLSMLQLIALAHELGHVKDMQNQNDGNFVYKPQPIVNLLEAEAYAHAFCLEYLHHIKAFTARDTLASSLFSLGGAKKSFEKKLYRSICQKVGKSRIKKWAHS